MCHHYETVPVNSRDLGEMLLSSVRYALGRHTGIANETRQWIERYAPNIEASYRQMCASSIREQLRREGYAPPPFEQRPNTSFLSRVPSSLLKPEQKELCGQWLYLVKGVLVSKEECEAAHAAFQATGQEPAKPEGALFGVSSRCQEDWRDWELALEVLEH